MEQLVLLVIIGLISLVNWVMQKAAEKREQAQLEREAKRESKRNIYTQPAPGPAARPARRALAPTQDPFKELMDALGLPSDQLPPPPVARREIIVEEEEFASVEQAPPLPGRRSGTKAAPWQPPAVRRADEKAAKLAAAFLEREKSPAQKPRATSVRSLLADNSSKRQAVILSEILGTPRGLARTDAFMTRGHL